MNTKTTFTKILLLFGMIVTAIGTHAQVKMGSNPQTIGASSLLELESTSKALVIPRMTTAQLSAISTPVAGMLVYNTDSNCIAQRTSSAWKYLCTTGGNASPLNWSVTGNSGTNSGSNFLGTTNNTGLKIRTNNTQRIVVDSVGKVGVGITTPATKLDVNGAIRTVPVALTAGTTVSTDASLGNYFTLTTAQNFTLANPTNGADGQRIMWKLKQDGTGSRTILLGDNFRMGIDIPTVTLSTTANKSDYIGAVYNSADGKWDIVAFVKGY